MAVLTEQKVLFYLRNLLLGSSFSFHLVRSLSQTVYNTKGARAHMHRELIQRGASRATKGQEALWPPVLKARRRHKRQHLHRRPTLHRRCIYKEHTSTHTHRELIREWLWEPNRSSLGYI